MPLDNETERDRRRNFNSLLILANLFRILSYFIVGLSAIFTLLAVVAALVSKQADTLLQLIASSSGVVVYGLLLFLVSELIRLLVGIGKDISRMSGRDYIVPQRDATGSNPPHPAPGPSEKR